MSKPSDDEYGKGDILQDDQKNIVKPEDEPEEGTGKKGSIGEDSGKGSDESDEEGH